MWAGVEPQHPPTKFTNPDSENSPRIVAMISGESSYSPISFGKPALGYKLV